MLVNDHISAKQFSTCITDTTFRQNNEISNKICKNSQQEKLNRSK